MSSPNDTNIRVRFTANTTQVKQMFGQINRLAAAVKKLGKSSTKMGNDIKKLGSRFDTTSSKSKKLAKTLASQTAKQDRAKASVQKLGRGMKGFNNNMDRANKSTKKTGSSLGFTGLAFGFIGGIAGFAANQIRTQFISVLEETSALLSEINRISLFSDLGFLNGEINPKGFGNAFTLAVESANKFGLSLAEIPTLLKEIEKASPASINISAFREAVLGFKTLENEVSTSALAGDLSTVLANFPEEEISDVADLLFAFSRESKLSFTAGSKAIAFAAQSAKLLNTPLNELLGTMVNIVAAVPGERGNAGRAIRAFIGNLTKLESVLKFKAAGIPILDDTGKRFIGLDKILSGFATKVQDIKRLEGDLAQVAFLEEFKLDKNALTGILAFVNATDEAKESARGVFTGIEGTQAKAVADQAKTVGAEFNRLKNSILRVKLEFTQGLSPALTELNALFGSVFADSQLVQVIRDFGAAIGKTLVGIATFAIPILRAFGEVFKNNEPLVQGLAVAMVALFAALSTITVVFPILGFFFALIFLHEKLIARSVELAGRATLVTKAYARLWAWIGRVNLRFKVWIAQLRAGNLSAGILSKQGLLGLRASLIRLGLGIKASILGWKVFTIAAIRAAAAALLAWSAAILPIVIAIAAFVIGVILAKRFEDQLLGLANSLDETGFLAKNLKSNIDGGFNLVVTGDFGPAFAIIERDLAGLRATLGRIGGAFGIFFSNIENSKAFGLLKNAIDKVFFVVDVLKFKVGQFVESLQFVIPNVWAFLQQRWINLTKSLDIVKGGVVAFGAILGINIPEVWGKLNEMWTGMKDNIDKMFQPLTIFLALLEFELPEPLKQLQGVIEGITKAWQEFIKLVAKDPIIAAGLELFGILGILDEDIKNAIKDQPLSQPIPPQPGTSGFIGPLQQVQPAILDQESLIAAGRLIFGYQEQLEAVSAQIEELNTTDLRINVEPFPEVLIPEFDPIAIRFEIAPIGSLLVDALKLTEPPKVVILAEVDTPEIPTIVFPVEPIQVPAFIGPIRAPTLPTLVFPPILPPEVPEVIIPVEIAEIPPIEAPEIAPIILTIEPTMMPTIDSILAETAQKLESFSVLPGESATVSSRGPNEDEQELIEQALAEISNINELFGIPEEFVDAIPGLLSDVLSVYEETVELLDVLNPTYSRLINTIVANDTAIKAETAKIIVHTSVLQVLIENLGLQIIEVIRNFNIISETTSIISNVNLMFARLIAEGNRAAGKLASLRVSKKGRFSISDPGISPADQARIDDATKNLLTTLENQINLEIPKLKDLIPQEEEVPQVIIPPVTGETTNTITINPTITINNAEGLDEEQIVALINAEFEATLQKNISSILTV